MKKQEVSHQESQPKRQSRKKHGLRRTSGMAVGPAETPEAFSHPLVTEEEQHTK